MKKKLKREVPQFVGYLKCHKVDMKNLNRVVKNEARQVLIDLSKTNTTMFFDSVRNKDWDWLEENLVPFQKINKWDVDKYKHFDAQIIISNHLAKDRIHRDDLRILYNNIFQKNKNANMFTRMCNLNGIKIKDVDFDGKTYKGYIFE